MTTAKALNASYPHIVQTDQSQYHRVHLTRGIFIHLGKQGGCDLSPLIKKKIKKIAPVL